jgi:deoxyribodipyrimidine photo-lyase
MSLFIFRRDFRVKDNTALNHCIENSKVIYPIFIFTPEQITHNTYKSDNAVMFMVESLIELKKELPQLTFCFGEIDEVIENIIKNNDIDMIYANTDYTPYSVKREKIIEKVCKKNDIILNLYHDITLFEPKSIKTGTGSIYQKFTPFYNVCIKKDVREPSTKKIKTVKHSKTKYEIDMKKIKTFYEENENIHIHGGRSNAMKILNNIKKFKDYDKTRNYLHIETTNLSAYLKFGCISIREAYHHCKDKLGKKDPLVRQLIWREFYYHLGDGFIEKFGNSLKEQYDNIKWENDITKFNKWKNAKTGYPIVDACMTQLNTTGYMHNRGRLIVSSFLIKNLMIDWRWGEKYFAQKLVDYDVFVNQGNWQWTSGSGADSQPYFRVFNPARQSETYDKDAIYIKKWLPFLNDIENKHLHDWEKYHTEYDIKYTPMVSYSESKKKGIAMYKKYL